MLWLQRSRITWLKEGDRNTQIFHRKAKWRASKIRIKRLKKENGSWEENVEEMQNMVVQYFSNLYTKDSNLDPGDVIDLVEPAVTETVNDALCKPFSDEEIADALF
jgi:hypothetical protein